MRTAYYTGLRAPAVILHGGAGRWLSRARRGLVGEALNYMVAAAEAALSTSDAFSAVVEALTVMEDSGVFNAGVGSVLNYAGEVEMDAGVMASWGPVGAVGAVKYPRNPIRLAAEVARRTRHILLVGEGADRMARRLGLPRHPGPLRRQVERYKHLASSPSKPEWAAVLDELYGADTIGAAAAWGAGLAAAASTGGIVLKHPGRVGDSAIPGAGFYASEAAACSATGIGEQIIRLSTCRSIVEMVEDGVNVLEAVKALVEEHNKVFGPGGVGVVVLTRAGEAAAAINTEAMPVCIADQLHTSAFLLH